MPQEFCAVDKGYRRTFVTNGERRPWETENINWLSIMTSILYGSSLTNQMMFKLFRLFSLAVMSIVPTNRQPSRRAHHRAPHYVPW